MLHHLFIKFKRFPFILALIGSYFFSAFAIPANAADLRLAIQPILSEKKTRAAFAPLARYLEQKTGHKIKIVTMPNFLSYWDLVRHPDQYELSLDAAHFTDYRTDKGNYEVLAKIPESIETAKHGRGGKLGYWYANVTVRKNICRHHSDTDCISVYE